MYTNEELSKPMERNVKSRVRKACEPCRRRKIRCDGYLPCSTCESFRKECHYHESAGIKKPLIASKKTQMYRELDVISDAFVKLKSSGTMNTETMSSSLLQMEEMLNGYRKRLELLPDSQTSSSDGSDSLEKVLFNRENLKFRENGTSKIVPYFGLYNPSCLESFDSIGWVLKKLDLKKEGPKYVFFYFLKLLDLGIKDYREVLTLTSFPSEWLSSRLKISGTPSEQVHLAIKTLNKDLNFDIDFSLGPFELVCNYATKMRQFNSNNPNRLSNLEDRLNQEEIILTAGFISFFPIIFSEMHNLKVISNIFSFLEANQWQMTIQMISRFVSEAVRRCLDLGLSRWEYYFSLHEDEAEYCRKIWWKCFWWDRWYSLLSGKPFLINEDHVVCLYPKFITNLGARNSMSAKELLDLFQPDEENIFLYIILSKIITEVYGYIAYNRKYTGGLQDCEAFSQDLLQGYRTTISSFDVLRLKSNLSWKNTADYNDWCLYFTFNYTQVACLSTIRKVLFRVKKVPDSLAIEKNYILCRQILLYVLQMDAPNLIYIFAGPICNFLVNFMYNLLEKGSLVYDLTIICRIAKLFSELRKETVESYFYVSYFKLMCLRNYIIVGICLHHHLSNSEISESGLIDAISEFDLEASKMCTKLLNKNSDLFSPLAKNTDMSNFHLALLEFFKKEIGPNFSEKVQRLLGDDYEFSFDQFDPLQNMQQIFLTEFDELGAFLNTDLSLENLREI